MFIHMKNLPIYISILFCYFFSFPCIGQTLNLVSSKLKYQLKVSVEEGGYEHLLSARFPKEGSFLFAATKASNKQGVYLFWVNQAGVQEQKILEVGRNRELKIRKLLVLTDEKILIDALLYRNGKACQSWRAICHRNGTILKIQKSKYRIEELLFNLNEESFVSLQSRGHKKELELKFYSITTLKKIKSLKLSLLQKYDKVIHFMTDEEHTEFVCVTGDYCRTDSTYVNPSLHAYNNNGELNYRKMLEYPLQVGEIKNIYNPLNKEYILLGRSFDKSIPVNLYHYIRSRDSSIATLTEYADRKKKVTLVNVDDWGRSLFAGSNLELNGQRTIFFQIVEHVIQGVTTDIHPILNDLDIAGLDLDQGNCQVLHIQSNGKETYEVVLAYTIRDQMWVLNIELLYESIPEGE